MAISLETLTDYNNRLAAEDDTDKSPILYDKYRIRLFPFSNLPIVNNFTSIDTLGFSSSDALIFDMPECVNPRPERDDEPVEKMDTSNEDDNKENSIKANEENVEIVGFDATTQANSLECNPIPLEDALKLRMNLTKSSEGLAGEISKLPIWISTTSKHLPSVAFLVHGAKSKGHQFAGCTKVLGYYCPEVEKISSDLMNTISEHSYSQSIQYRAIHEVVPCSKTEVRKNPGKVTVDMTWTTGRFLEPLLAAPNSMTNCEIKIDLGWKDERFFTDTAFFKQLFFVLNLADVLKHPENEVIFDPVTEVAFDELVAQMEEVVKKCSDAETGFAVSKSGEEVTEQVWNVLCLCTSLKQVTVLLKNFLQALQYGMVKAQVHHDNRSILAQLIKSSKSGGFRMPRLERLYTIEMLMEIGVEYLRRALTAKFASSFGFPEEEVEMTLRDCEKEMMASQGAVESRAIALLPVSMSLSALFQLFALINENTNTVMHEMTRRVLGKFSAALITQSRTGQADLSYTFDINLPLSRLSKNLFESQRPKVWTCEVTNCQGGRLCSKMMTCLQLQMPLDHVNEMVNAVRPVKKIEEGESLSLDEMKADYTVSHTILAYYTKNADSKTNVLPAFIPCDQLLGWNLSVVNNPITKKDEYTYTVCCQAAGAYRVIEENVVMTKCDGPCAAILPSKQMIAMGKCEHLLCKACYGIVKNPDGSYGCSNFHCWAEPLASFQKEKAKYKKIIKKQKQRARKLKEFGEDVKSCSENALPQSPSPHQ
ncbi:unnamed protein product [Caenorhabditis bovis]|uniref:Protein zwilch n=1 Tax=Caenorhabditis bovis TaxID=2654633 RepID=A0A8S1EZ15_9PELO|nr:unnamed protein product [Caenorhabditis bovis]